MTRISGRNGEATALAPQQSATACIQETSQPDELQEMAFHDEDLNAIELFLGQTISRSRRRALTRAAKHRRANRVYPIAHIEYSTNNRYMRHKIPQNTYKPKRGGYIDVGKGRHQQYLDRFNQPFNPQDIIREDQEVEMDLQLDAEWRDDPWDYMCYCDDICRCSEIFSFTPKLRCLFYEVMRYDGV